MDDKSVEPDTVGADELLYRKIPVSLGWYDPSVSSKPSPEAFRPNRDRDGTGISFDRARSEKHPEFPTIEEAGQGQSPDGYYVAVLRMGDLRSRSIEVVPRPIEGNPGHAELPALNSNNRRSDEAIELKRLLADELTLVVEGPFTIG
jgi:hypothetical protein